MADLSSEALQTVKKALKIFQADIDGLGLRASDASADIMEDCRNQMNRAKVEIAEAGALIASLEDRISNSDAKIAQASSEYSALTVRASKIQGCIQSRTAMMCSLNAQVSSLRAKLSGCGSDEERQQIQNQMVQLERQIAQCDAERSQLETELDEMEQSKSKLQQTIRNTKAEKAKMEEELLVQRHRNVKLSDKYERLKTAFHRVESDLQVYVSAAKQFESSASEKTQRNTNAVDKCISMIEEYLATSF